MSVFVESGDLTCDECSQSGNFADLYRCDGCGRIVCEDCLPTQEEFSPAEFCEACMDEAES